MWCRGPALQVRSPWRSSRQRLYQAPIRAREILASEDTRAGDKQVRAGEVELADVVRPDASVDLDVDVVRQQLAQRADASDRLGHELLARVARVDAHAEDEIEALGGAHDVLGGRLRIEGEADLEPLLAG